MSDRQTGTVKWFNDAKGFGFITPQSGPDLFVHFRSIQGNGFKSLQEGQQVRQLQQEGRYGEQQDGGAIDEALGDDRGVLVVHAAPLSHASSRGCAARLGARPRCP